MNGIDKIKEERLEHLSKHKRSVLRDVKENSTGQLREGARKLLVHHPETLTEHQPEGWDKKLWAKMCNESYEKRLIIAGSLIAAEIDRINYDTK